MELLLWSIIFIVSLGVLLKSADYFTEAAEKLGRFLRMSPFIVGVLIVAFGTSLPEIITSISSVLQNESGMVAGNVLGTVIANTLLGLGLAAIFCKGIVKPNWDIFYGDFPILVMAIIMVVFTTRNGNINFYETLLFIFGLLIYFFYLKEIHKEDKKTRKKEGELNWRVLATILLGLIGLILAAKYTVFSIINISVLTGLETSVLATVLIAVGTSFPEIAVAISAAKKRNWDLLVGDIIGSNIFDIFAIFGICGIFSTLTITSEIMTIVIPFLIATLVLNWVVLADKKITTSEGIIMVLLYVVFIGKIFNLF